MARQPSSFSQQLWFSVLAGDVALLLLLGWSFLHLEPGTPSYVIGQVSLVPLVATLVGVLVVLYSGWEPF